MQRLMDVSDKMNQKSQIARCAPSVVAAVFQALRVLVYFPRHASAAGASQRNVCPAVLQADVDEVPGRGRSIFVAELEIRADRSGFHRSCDRARVRRHPKDTRHMALRGW